MTYWVYHERQEAMLCGQHALNNLVQANAFTPGSLAEIAGQLDQMELNYMASNNEGGVSSKDYLKRIAEGSGNVDESGNFSIEVLRSALLSRYNLELPNIRQQGLSKLEITTMDGFICNRSSHWFAIRKINDRYWNLNSTLERPEVISHFRLAAEMEALQNSGYSVFCVVDSLPPPCTNEAMMDQGLVSILFYIGSIKKIMCHLPFLLFNCAAPILVA
jgi:ataxin-3